MRIGHISSFLLRKRQALIYFSLLLVLVDLHAGIHPANLVHGVLTLPPAAVAVWRFVPTMFFRMPAEAEGFQAFLVWFCIAGDPYKAPYDFDFNAVQLQEHSNQPLEFLRRFPRLFLLRFTTLFWLDAKIWFIYSLGLDIFISRSSLHIYPYT